ncbi:hypothetical protein PCH70_47310 [Pseudomonas cichorii JBC1]|nr:hypothetical protein PCH70_47310 [Pseudomonas cichorii JBC1]
MQRTAIGQLRQQPQRQPDRWRWRNECVPGGESCFSQG